MQIKKLNPPHPIPYQGSKRKIAVEILSIASSMDIHTLFEPFAGSAAITLASARIGLAKYHHINDSLEPLMQLWSLILNEPTNLAYQYEVIWNGHIESPVEHYYNIRSQFNLDKDPAKLLYLMARCVKNAIRFNEKGEFNQSSDKRRLGTSPGRMKKEILGAHSVLKNKTIVTAQDYRESLVNTNANDLVYLDPPWQGTSGDKDRRYYQILNKENLIEELESLNVRGIPFLLSFDGRLGNKMYGEELPRDLNLVRLEIHAGRSSQSTLSGGSEETFESLYVSPVIIKKLNAMSKQSVISKYLPRVEYDRVE
jgi:DNA adenine methylase